MSGKAELARRAETRIFDIGGAPVIRTTVKLLGYQLKDALRSRWVLAYGLFFLLATDALFRFGGTGEAVLLSLMNVVLLVVPLVAIVLGAMYLYNARETIELLLSQPVERGALFLALYGGLFLPLAGAFAVGTGLPFLYHGAAAETGGGLILLLGVGTLLTAAFTSLSFFLALSTEDRIRGLGLALLAWLFFAVVYDGLVLLFIQAFSAYPIQRAVIALSLLNPIDLGRIQLLLGLDMSALMGFTGAVFRRFLGGTGGRLLSLGALAAWFAIPFLLGRRAFLRKNF